MDAALQEELTRIYQQVMWLAQQPGVTHSMARAWYTHVWANRLKNRIRLFTGKVSMKAANDPAGVLRLEHFMRIQTKLTSFVKEHLESNRNDPEAFIQLLTDCERVHIVTIRENYDALVAAGDYLAAGIELVDWGTLSQETRAALWKKMLRGRVENASIFQPKL